MSEQIKNIVLEIDNEIRQNKWFDFHVLKFDGCKLIIAGSVDLIYYHTLEIIFEDVFFVSGFFRGWHSETENRVFLIPENVKEMNEKYEIEQGYELFVFKTEDYKSDIIISAKNITYKTETVYYYKENEI